LFDLQAFYTYNNYSMRDWNLRPGDPLQLTIAADARLVTPEYANDHIWELDLGGGDPSAVGLRTTYGLRARLMRLFPRFGEGDKTISDPADFAVPPRVRRFYPNFLEVAFSPFPRVEVTAEYWIPSSNVVAGRLTIANRATAPHPMRLEWTGQLIPLEGQSMSAVQRQSVTVLEGQVGDLLPVLFMTGGPQPGPGPYPSLALMLDLAPGSTRQVTWAMATLKNAQASFDLARRNAARPFDAERARIELVNNSQTIQITTGDPDWDAALTLSQKSAFGLFMGPSENLPQPSFVLSRQPDAGHSRLGDGSDHPYFWSGQSPFEAYYLGSLLPGAPQLIKGVVQNFLSVQEREGFIDCKPGLAGQRGRFLAAPYLVSLGWRACGFGQDKDCLAQIYPGLHSFFWAWFSPQRDQDRNGLPEWQHTLQTGFEENPLFDGWHAWSYGVDITTVQSPSLSAALYREAQCLIQMAGLLGRQSDTVLLKKQAEVLKNGLEAAFDSDSASYRYTDRDTHLCQAGKIISERQAAPEVSLQKEFKQPVRLLIRILGEDKTLKRPRVTIQGQFEGQDQQESLNSQDFAYSSGGAVATSRKVYTNIGQFEFDGLNRHDRINLQTVDLTITDHTLLLPLWAGVPSEHEAHTMLYRSILDAGNFDHPFGMPALPQVFAQEADPVCLGVHLPWNQLIGEGLLAYGYRREAARLVAHMMSAVIQNLKKSQAFYSNYHAETGAGLGERNALHGLAPVGFFLQTLGVEIHSPNRVKICGENPFPWPVTVKYRGLTVTRQMDQTEVIFPNGQSVTRKDPTDAVVSCE